MTWCVVTLPVNLIHNMEIKFDGIYRVVMGRMS